MKGAYKELRKTDDARLQEHIIESRMAQGEKEARGMTEQEIQELVETWVIVKLKAFQPPLSHAQSLSMKICPKCRKKHAGADGELAEAETGQHGHVDDGSQGSSNGSLKEPETPPDVEPVGLDVQPVKNPATVITSSVVV
jgi:hypothetical protein